MNLSENNIKIAMDYSIRGRVALNDKDEDFINLFLSYFSDKNSSSLREAVTLMYCKYIRNHDKHGADGYDPLTERIKEVKPSYLAEGKKLGSSGNFNDMTMDLLEKKKDYDIIDSVFHCGRLAYIVEFPLIDIYDVLSKPILNAKIGKRVVCHFKYSDYANSNLKIHYYDPSITRMCLQKKHDKFLREKVYGPPAKLFEC